MTDEIEDLVPEGESFSRAEVMELLTKREAHHAHRHQEAQTVLDEANAERTKLEERLQDQETELLAALKIEVIRSAGLPDAMSERLVGTTRDELAEDAQALAESIGPRGSVGSGTNPPTDSPKPLTRADIKGMSPQEVIEHMDQIESQLRDGSLVKA